MDNTFVNTIVFVRDLDKSKYFYNEILGIKVKRDLDTIVFFENQLVLHGAESIIKTIFGEKPIHEVMGYKNVLLYFETSNLEELYESLKDKVEMIHKIEKQEWGQKVFRFYDLDRHIVEFGESENSK